MRVVIVYRRESDHGREVVDYLRDFDYQTGYKLEECNPDTRQGMDFCRVYDIVEYPTLIALSNDGQVQQVWRGRPLPLIGEVSYYAAQS